MPPLYKIVSVSQLVSSSNIPAVQVQTASSSPQGAYVLKREHATYSQVLELLQGVYGVWIVILVRARMRSMVLCLPNGGVKPLALAMGMGAGVSRQS
jgi:hypothetical protein